MLFIPTVLDLPIRLFSGSIPPPPKNRPMLFVVYAMDLKPMSEHNRIIKYADDTTGTLLVAEKSSVDVAIEFGHLEDCSRHNKLAINKDRWLK